MPRKELIVPSFRNETEEAAWWEKHRAAVEADLRRAMRQGRTTTIGEVLAQARQDAVLQPITIRLPKRDIATARHFASERGIGYQTYIKLLLHDALRREAGRRENARRQ